MSKNCINLKGFEILIKNIDEKLNNSNNKILSKYNYTMKLIYDYNKLNDYGKIIFKNSSCTFLLAEYENADFSFLKIKTDVSQKFINFCRERDSEEAYRFIFWSLMILSMDETNKDEKLSLICDFASIMNIKDYEILDIIKIIKLIYNKYRFIYGENFYIHDYDKKFSESDFKSNKIKKIFKSVLEMYEIKVKTI